MAWVLQPCRTHEFALLKDNMFPECQLFSLTFHDGKLTMTLLFQALAGSFAVVLRGRSWQVSFWDVRMTGVQVSFSEMVLT